MSRGRFGLLLAALVLGLGATSFVGVYALIDGGSDTPAGVDDSSPTTRPPSSLPTSTVPGGLVTPAFIAIVASEKDEGKAQAIRDELTESGYDAGVLHSDDFPSLQPGFWVAYVGPFTQVPEADATQVELVADGYTTAYTSCVGTAEDC